MVSWDFSLVKSLHRNIAISALPPKEKAKTATNSEKKWQDLRFILPPLISLHQNLFPVLDVETGSGKMVDATTGEIVDDRRSMVS